MSRHKKTIHLGITAVILMAALFILVIWGIGFVRQLIDARLKETLIVDFQNNANSLGIPEYTGIEPKPPVVETQPTSTQPIIEPQTETTKPTEITRNNNVSTAGLTYAGFSDLFSGVGWLDQDKTTMYRDNMTTAFTFPPKYEWNETNPSFSTRSKLESLTNGSATIGNKTLSVNNNLLSLNGSIVSFPTEINGLQIDNISVVSLDTKWLVGIVIKVSGGYEGHIYSFNGSDFSKINTNLFISQYKGVFGFGGTDNDWIALYGAYRGIAVHASCQSLVLNCELTDISRFFDYRIMNSGFTPMIIRSTFNFSLSTSNSQSPVWFIYSLTLGNPKLIKLFQNNTSEIQGALDFTPNLIKNVSKAVFVPEGNKLIGWVGGLNAMHFYEFKDLGFDKSNNRFVYSVNISNYPAEVRVARIYREDIATQGANIKLYLSNDNSNWIPVSLKETISFPNQSNKRIYWRADFTPDNNPTTSSFFDFIGIEYYVKFL